MLMCWPGTVHILFSHWNEKEKFLLGVYDSAK